MRDGWVSLLCSRSREGGREGSVQEDSLQKKWNRTSMTVRSDRICADPTSARPLDLPGQLRLPKFLRDPCPSGSLSSGHELWG